MKSFGPQHNLCVAKLQAKCFALCPLLNSEADFGKTPEATVFQY